MRSVTLRLDEEMEKKLLVVMEKFNYSVSSKAVLHCLGDYMDKMDWIQWQDNQISDQDELIKERDIVIKHLRYLDQV